MADLSWDLAGIARIVGGDLKGEGAIFVSGVCIDSREPTTGCLFVALKGERLDGHDFAQQAALDGAAGLMVEREIAGVSCSQILVNDSLEALQILGHAARVSFEGKVAAITGSNGKTTTRKILASILEQQFKTHQPKKNFNNHIGVPLTLMELNKSFEAAVIELGCSDFEEIELLTRLVEPDVALVTNVGPAHLEKLGDLDGVARAKGELFAGLRRDAVAVVNLDDPRVAQMETSAWRRITFGAAQGAQVRLESCVQMGAQGQSLVMTVEGKSISARLPIPGKHNAANVLAATAAAVGMGIDLTHISQGIESVRQFTGRLELKAGPRGSLIIDDTYNANPESMRAALEVLVEVAGEGRRFAAISDMLELGRSSREAHEGLGESVTAAGLTLLVTMGEGGAAVGHGAIEAGMSPDRLKHAGSHEDAARLLGEILETGDTLLVKGSRGMQMERIVANLIGGKP
jgi:UDP-N-acetylmuramoyl-tripeptide--D-alanyl-D-alanine ligase